MKLRDYQARAVDRLFNWWATHPGMQQVPIVVMPTGSGKSVVIAEVVRRMWAQWPDHRPRTLVLVPSKELAEQNAAKLAALLPDEVTIGLYSASLNRKDAMSDVIVATIGSVYRRGLELGDIRAVLIDECHLVDSNGKGRYRQLLNDLQKVCTFRAAGFTATPFRGNGVWLTAGEKPLFTGIADTVTVNELLEAGHLAPLVPPEEKPQTQVDTTGVSTTSGDYNLAELEKRVEDQLQAAADEAVRLAADRHKWIAFLPTVEAAGHFRDILCERGISAEVVTGDTPAIEREAVIHDFREGCIRCLITVLALATGFDVPDVDCIIWLRPTISPVLYVQGAGRGMRPAPGKTDCLWLDFTDTTERLGPVDAIRGRTPKRTGGKKKQPKGGEKYCANCGEPMPASARYCTACGHIQPVNYRIDRQASDAPVLSQQVEPERKPVFEVHYRKWEKPGKPPTLRVDYMGALRQICSEWICFEHTGFARRKAEQWWKQRSDLPVPNTVEQALGIIYAEGIMEPRAVFVRPDGQYTRIVGYEDFKMPEPEEMPF